MANRLRRAVLVAAVLVLLVPAGPTAGATGPDPAPALITDPYGINFAVFYPDVESGHLIEKVVGSGSEDLGGTVTGGAAGMSIQPDDGYWWVFVRDESGAVQYRKRYTGGAGWLDWQSLGGGIVGTPTASCVADGPPVVWVRGTNDSLYQRVLAPGHGWRRLGGTLTSDPSAVPTVMGACPDAEDVFMLGGNHAIYEWNGARFRRISGATDVAPAAVRDPEGGTVLFVRGPNHALYVRARAPGSALWSNWVGLGGQLASAPAVTVFQGEPVVVVWGTNDRLYRGQFTEDGSWLWAQIT